MRPNEAIEAHSRVQHHAGRLCILRAKILSIRFVVEFEQGSANHGGSMGPDPVAPTMVTYMRLSQIR